MHEPPLKPCDTTRASVSAVDKNVVDEVVTVVVVGDKVVLAVGTLVAALGGTVVVEIDSECVVVVVTVVEAEVCVVVAEVCVVVAVGGKYSDFFMYYWLRGSVTAVEYESDSPHPQWLLYQDCRSNNPSYLYRFRCTETGLRGRSQRHWGPLAKTTPRRSSARK